MTQQQHVTKVGFTGSGCRARCLTRGCNWTGPNRLGVPIGALMAMAWNEAESDGRRHVTDEQRKERREV